MRASPVLQEGIQIYWTEGHALVVYGYLLFLLAAAEFLTLFLPGLDPQSWMGPAHIFRISAISAATLIVYFVLRLSNQEFVPWRFAPLRRWLRQEGVSASDLRWAQFELLSLHVVSAVLLAAPLLLWAAAIARAPAVSVFWIFVLLFFYAFTYGIWGLVALALWERKVESRQVFIRALWISLFFLSPLLYAPLSPVVFLLSYLGRKEMAPLALWGWKGSGAVVHLLFHLFLLGAGLLAYRRALGREP